MYCEICGNYITEYQNPTIQEDEKAIVTKNSPTQHENKIKTEFHSVSIDSDIERNQRVLSLKVEFDGNEIYAIIDTGSNLSFVEYSLIKDKQHIKPKEQIIITGAGNDELVQIGTTELTIKINKFQYQIKAYVIKSLNCKLLLGNDFNIKYNLIVDFKNKNIRIENNNIIKNGYNMVQKEWKT